VLIPASQLHTRSQRRTYCFSPWQTIPVDVAGNVTLCDCQPDQVAGNLLREPLSDIWNGKIMREHRARMLSDNPPEACRVCPRF
jgi:radical SAM protein with 4Fe4S-binding SPASM domain